MALTAADLRFITLSFEEARRSLDHGGLLSARAWRAADRVRSQPERQQGDPIAQAKGPRLVINKTVPFGGNEAFLRGRGVEVIDASHEQSIRQMGDFIAANQALWNEDVME